MDIEYMNHQERVNTGTSWTKHESFDKDGYFVVKNLWNVDELYHPVPEERGQINYYGSEHLFNHDPVEHQVEGSLARYSHPMYKSVHSGIRIKLEKLIGRQLYNTYYYDRYYFSGQELKRHTDRDACEISVTVHIGTNLDKPWPVCIKTPQGEERSVTLSPGDGMVYKGCERPHWRDAMPTKKKGLFQKKEELYYHQIFFHYVLADGQRAHCAFDMAR